MDIFTVLLIQPLANGLALAYKLLGQNMGIAIIGFSVFLRFALNPLTKPYMQSMKKMREYSKELEKIKNRHKGDRQKLMQAQADFYKEKGINPSAGCLPYLLQIVILIALFRVFTLVLSGDGDVAVKFNEFLYPTFKFAENTLVNTQFLHLDITKPDVINIPGLSFPLPGVLLLLAAFLQFVSAKITAPYISAEEKLAKQTEAKSDDIQVAMQSSMIYTFPIITILAGMSFPSGLALYWLVFSVFQTWQQYKTSGWGGLTPFLIRLGLVQLPDSNGKGNKNRGRSKSSRK
ncbi:membrane protein insertase YidC [Candidatus Microgenomates bacterium]|nr:MAG: membrane protein insertase YidC [Candidatus Microgenomates bacterium]